MVGHRFMCFKSVLCACQIFQSGMVSPQENKRRDLHGSGMKIFRECLPCDGMNNSLPPDEGGGLTDTFL